MSVNITGKEIISILAQGKIPPRLPFAPTIFEHSARILNVKPSDMAKDIELVVNGQLAAYELYKHDIVSVGVDIYNLEAEALGCPMIYYEDNTLPSTDGAIISNPCDLKNICVPDPAKAGRMPMFIEACQRINAKIGKEVPVGGTIVGPFTLAAILRGFENFLMDLLFDEEFAQAQLKFACQVALEFAKGFIKNGISVSINESWITPPLLSPNLFKEKVFDIEKELITSIKAEGAISVALISGGNTTPIADYLVQTGTSLLMADANTDQKAYKVLCEKMNINLRASIESKIVELGNVEEMTHAVQKVIDNCASNGRFIFGCGVVSYNTSPENVIKLKGIVEKLNPYR